MDYKWLVTSLIVVAGLAIGLWQYVETRRKQLLVDLQGDKNAVAAVAMRVRSGRFPRWRSQHRRELFEALCVAAVFETSGRSRSLIYGALANTWLVRQRHANMYRQEIRQIVDSITVTVSRSSAYTDLGRAQRRLIDLRAALSLESDVRLRLGSLEVNTDEAGRYWPPYERLRHPVFAWDDLETLVQRLGRLVLVGTASPCCPVISLDYHRVTRKVRRDAEQSVTPTSRTPERPVLTSAGRQVVEAKYGEATTRQTHASTLAEKLSIVIATHPVFADAPLLAAVPGTTHAFSGRLGSDLATRASKDFVVLKATADSTAAARKFAVVNPSAVKSKSVILVDDVYRTGQTLQAAAATLRDAGATSVFGLTATCTSSATAYPCSHDRCADDKPGSETVLRIKG